MLSNPPKRPSPTSRFPHKRVDTPYNNSIDTRSQIVGRWRAAAAYVVRRTRWILMIRFLFFARDANRVRPHTVTLPALRRPPDRASGAATRASGRASAAGRPADGGRQVYRWVFARSRTRTAAARYYLSPAAEHLLLPPRT